jgi:superfamily II DNA or RNA helicase
MNGDLFDTHSTFAFPPPRECQTRAIESLREGLRAGHRNQLLVLPTGGGKTIASLMLISESLKKGRRATFVCDRITLINQCSENADKYGLHHHGIVQANHWRRDNSLPFQIASVQTIGKRGYWPPADLVVIDEAHVLHAAHKELLTAGRTPVIGLTATPCTRGLGKYFTNVVNAATMHELTEAEVLVPMKILSCTAPDMKGAATDNKGEWTREAASEREAKIIGDVVAEWIAHGENRKTIAFGADIAYCGQLVQRFNAAGVSAAAYTSETSDAECADLLQEFRKPDSAVRILVSVEKLAKGFDVPDVGCVIDARPLRKSLSTAIQMWGRGLRSSPGKTNCILLDFTRNIVRFMPEFEDIYYNGFRSLDESEKLDSKPREDDSDFTPAGCPQCAHKPFSRRCLACGFEKPTQALEDTSVGEMREVVIGSGKNRKVLAADEVDLWRQVCGYARAYSKPEKQAGRAANLFRNITGRWPPREFVFDQTESSPVTRNTRNKIKSLDWAWRAMQTKTRHEAQA